MNSCVTKEKRAHDTGDRSRCPDHRCGGIGVCREVCERSDQAAAEIEDQIERSAPDVLDERAGQIENQHVAEEMKPARVQEHMCHQRVGRDVVGYQAEGEQRMGAVRLKGLGAERVQLELLALEHVPLCRGGRVPLEGAEHLLHRVRPALAEGELLQLRVELEVGVLAVVLKRVMYGAGEVDVLGGEQLTPPGRDEDQRAKPHDAEGNPRQAAYTGFLMADRQQDHRALAKRAPSRI
jgi:hypothetical protein